jgi:hypothetical protein
VTIDAIEVESPGKKARVTMVLNPEFWTVYHSLVEVDLTAKVVRVRTPLGGGEGMNPFEVKLVTEVLLEKEITVGDPIRLEGYDDETYRWKVFGIIV